MTNRPRARSRSRLTSMLAGSLATVVAFVLAALLASGSAPAQTQQTQAAPTNTSLPTVSGSAVAGQTLTASPGSWSGDTPITFAYQWLRCNSGGSSCNPIVGETGVNRLVDSGDVGSTLRIRVTATNASGATSADSNSTPVVTSSGGGGGGGGGSGPPVNSTLPSVSGSPVQGQSLVASPGTWNGAPTITFTYEWQRCDANVANCSAISGETGTSRLVDSGDVGSRLRVKVTATNSAGSNSATSAATEVVTASGGGSSSAPKNTVLPTITGTPTKGQTLTASTGTWTGKTPITFSDQWYRCDSGGGNCVAIAGETGPTRVVDSGDVGFRLKVRVTATNSVGTTNADSAVTDVVTTSGTPPPGNLPPGAITLPNGKISIPATSVPADQRLVIDSVRFTPNPVRSRTGPITIRVHISDTRGYWVRDVLVFVRSVPILTSTPPEALTAQNGVVEFQVLPRADFPLKNGYAVQFFVRARRTGDDPLAGVGTRRLVQVLTGSGQ